MSYQIEVLRSTQKEIKELPGHVRSRARKLIKELAQNPRPPRTKELRDRSGTYRIWLAGHWRIAYQIDDDLKLIRVLQVRRKEQAVYFTAYGLRGSTAGVRGRTDVRASVV